MGWIFVHSNLLVLAILDEYSACVWFQAVCRACSINKREQDIEFVPLVQFSIRLCIYF